MQKITFLLFTAFLLNNCVETVIGGVAAGAYFSAREKSVKSSVTDTTITTKIKAQYLNKENRKKLRKIEINSEEGRVLLKGRVEKKDDAINAVKIAWKVKGAKEVINEIKIGKENANFIKDVALATQIKTKLIMDKSIKAINYNVEVEDSVVYLLGQARSRSEIRRAAKIASKERGVKKVVSHARVSK